MLQGRERNYEEAGTVLMGIKWVLLAIIGIGGGLCVAGGIFAFISILELIPRLLSRFRATAEVYFMETAIFWGGLAGSLLSVFKWQLPIGYAGLMVFGLFSGIFVGCLAMSLAETVKVIPVMLERTKLAVGLPSLILAMALGKALASFYQLYFRFK